METYVQIHWIYRKKMDKTLSYKVTLTVSVLVIQIPSKFLSKFLENIKFIILFYIIIF